MPPRSFYLAIYEVRSSEGCAQDPAPLWPVSLQGFGEPSSCTCWKLFLFPPSLSQTLIEPPTVELLIQYTPCNECLFLGSHTGATLACPVGPTQPLWHH